MGNLMAGKDLSLSELRQQMDALDDQLHELLMERFALVGDIAAAKAGEPVPRAIAMRPGREAQVLRRVLAQHRGALPAGVILKIWRELVSAATWLQGHYSVHVFSGAQADLFWDLARFYFGALTPMTKCNSADDVVRAVTQDPKVVGMLPVFDSSAGPSVVNPSSFTGQNGQRVHIIARLPFVRGSDHLPEYPAAFVISSGEPEASGDDTSILMIRVEPSVSASELTGALETLKFSGIELMVGPDGSEKTCIVAVNGMIGAKDLQLAMSHAARPAWMKDAVVLGAYANPIELPEETVEK